MRESNGPIAIHVYSSVPLHLDVEATFYVLPTLCVPSYVEQDSTIGGYTGFLSLNVSCFEE